MAFSPERIDPGNDRHAHEDVPRVLGGVTPRCAPSGRRPCCSSYAKNVHLVPSTDAAEMTKLVENTFRAVNIALANEFAEICQVMGMDVMDVINAAATKPYGFMPFFPGPGVGGHCIPCDPHYLLWQLRRERLSTPVIEQAMAAIAGASAPRGRTDPGDAVRRRPGPVRRAGPGRRGGLQARRRGPARVTRAGDHGGVDRAGCHGGLLRPAVPDRRAARTAPR